MSCERNFSNSVVLLTVSPALHTKFAEENMRHPAVLFTQRR